MPRYDFKCDDCAEVFEVTCKVSEREEQHCPKCSSKNYHTHFSTGVPIGDPVRLGVRGLDNGFKEVLSKIAGNNYRSNLADKLSRK